MGKFDGVLICTDLDGTLLGNDKRISDENLEAIARFEREGGYFTFVTGRMPFFVTDIYRTVRPNAPIGCINGGGVFDFERNTYLWKRELPRAALELVGAVEQGVEGVGIQINTFDRVYFAGENESMKNFRAVTGVPNLTCHYNDVHEPIAKVVFGDEEEARITQIRDTLLAHPRAGEFDFIRSERTLFEILPKGSGKGSVLPVLAEILGINMARTVAIGDYYNDIAMLRAAGIGVAVENARPEVKAAADHITVSNDEHAIAHVIADLESGRISF